MSPSLRPFAGFVLAGLVAAPLSGCGKTGELERPAPMFGKGRPQAPAAASQTPAQDPSRPVQTVDPRDRSTDPGTPRALPIEGTSPDPGEAAPQGVLPNPRATPDQ